MNRRKNTWATSSVVGLVLVVQLLNVLWHLAPWGSLPSPPRPESPQTVKVEKEPEVHHECPSPFPSNEKQLIDFLKTNHSGVVQKLKLEQAPYPFTEYWAEMQKAVLGRHFLKDIHTPREGSKYEKVMNSSLMERENILEGYYRHRSEFASVVQSTAHRIKVNNTVVLMAFNYGTMVLFFNWLCSCRQANIDVSNVLVISADNKTHSLLGELNVTSLYLPRLFGDYQSHGVRAFGNHEWSPFGRLKMLVPKLLLEAGIDVFFQDVDMIWLKDPVAYIRSTFPEYDVVIQHVGKNRAMFGPFYGNSGVFFIKGNIYARSCWDRVFFDMDKVVGWSGSQQMVLNYHLGLCAAPGGPMGLRVTNVDPYKFVSGWVAQNKKMQHELSTKTGNDYEKMILYHTNWANNVKEKIEANLKYKFWYLPPTVTDKTDPRTLNSNYCV